MYEPHTLKRWELPDSYFGAEWSDYFVSVGQHRDSDSLSRSNFECTLRELGGESETVQVVREGHWAVGWIEWIAIHESDCTALRIADDISAALTDYPVLNEDHWSELQWDEACEYWQGLRVRDRIDYCQRAGLSIFAARHDDMPMMSELVELLAD
jgi:hypothetical protein